MVMLVDLFDHSVDNDKIFAMIGPAFNTVVGAFVGLLGGLSINRAGQDKKSKTKKRTTRFK